MKIQTKTVLLSVAFIALALTAVTGVTYAWFSDTESAEVETESAKVDFEIGISPDNFLMASYGTGNIADPGATSGTFSNGGTVLLTKEGNTASVTIDRMSPGDKVVFGIDVFNHSNIQVSYRILKDFGGSSPEEWLKVGVREAVSKNMVPFGIWYELEPEGSVPAMEVTIEMPPSVGPAHMGKSTSFKLQFDIKQGGSSGSAPITDIKNMSDLNSFRDKVNGGYDYSGIIVRLSEDISMSGQWTPIGTAAHPFRGYFDGYDHTVSNMETVGDISGSGLFGYIDRATLVCLNMNDCRSFGENDVGVLVGHAADSTISSINLTNCGSTGSRNVGGVAGAADTSVIHGCTAQTVIVHATPSPSMEGGYAKGDNVGVVAGFLQNGDITECEVNGRSSAIGYNNIGGIVGTVSSSIGCFTGVHHNYSDTSTSIVQRMFHNYSTDFTGSTFHIDNYVGHSIGDESGLGLPDPNKMGNVKLQIGTEEELLVFLDHCPDYMLRDVDAGVIKVEIIDDITLSEKHGKVSWLGDRTGIKLTLDGNGHTVTGIIGATGSSGDALFVPIGENNTVTVNNLTVKEV